MREDKYRAWDQENKIMISAEELGSGKDCRLTLLNPLTGKFWDVELQCSFDPNQNDGLKPIKYIGLKDENGTEIYDGDILKIYPGFGCEWEPYIDVVKWDEENFRWKISKYHYISSLDYDCTFEVIGNIYENPELLNG